VVVDDRTGVTITGGTMFGTSASASIPVTLTTIKVDATGGGVSMQSIKVYAGSGPLPGAATDGTLVTSLPAAGLAMNPTKVTISTFANPAPPYDAATHESYWVWIVIVGTEDGVTKTINGSKEFPALVDTYAAAFYDYE
jgi:hypothetical protein